jgi:hypothetical protein
LTNVSLLALVGFLWQLWLRSVAVDRLLSVLIPLVGVTCLAQEQNITCGWQACILLAAAGLIAVLWAYSSRQFGYAAILSCLAAFTFASHYILPAAVAGWLLYDYAIQRDRRLLGASLGFVALFGFLLCLPRLFAAASSGQLFGALWQGPTFLAKLAHLFWLGWYTLGVAFYGPANHLFRGWLPDGPSSIMTVASLVGFFLVLLLDAKPASRILLWKLLVLQFALFAMITPFRHTPSFAGYADRYYTSGLIPWLSAVALGITECFHRFRISAAPRKLIHALLILLALRNARCALIEHDSFFVQCGRAARIDYYQTKEWLRRQNGRPLGNICFSQSVAPWLDLKMLLPVIRLLDPSFATFPVVLKNVYYLQNTVNTRGWGPIVEGHPAIQTFRLPRRATAESLELLVSRDRGFDGMGQLSIADEAGKSLWSVTIPSNLWPANTWLAVPIDALPQLEPARTYSIRVASSAKEPAAPTVWMTHRPPPSFAGETRTPDGVTGVLCFRLGLSEP